MWKELVHGSEAVAGSEGTATTGGRWMSAQCSTAAGEICTNGRAVDVAFQQADMLQGDTWSSAVGDGYDLVRGLGGDLVSVLTPSATAAPHERHADALGKLLAWGWIRHPAGRSIRHMAYRGRAAIFAHD